MQPNSSNQLGRCGGTAGKDVVLLVLVDLVVTADFPASGSGGLSLLGVDASRAIWRERGSLTNCWYPGLGPIFPSHSFGL